MQLLQKVYNFQDQGKMLEIKSAVCLDHLKGFIYVEAYKDSHVRIITHTQLLLTLLLSAQTCLRGPGL